MKKNNKILLLMILFCLFTIFVIELTSPTSLYRDPYMFKHFAAAEFIKENNTIEVIKTPEQFPLFPWILLNRNSLIFFPMPVLIPITLSYLSGLDLYFLFNHFFFLALIVVLSFFVFFRELFKENYLSLFLALLVLFFPFEPFYYKISLHGWFIVRICSAMSLYFLVKLIKNNFSIKSKNMFFLLFFSFVGIYSDKSFFALLMLPLILFLGVYFFLKRKQLSQKKVFLNWFISFFFIVFCVSALVIFGQLSWILNGLIYNLSNFNFIPSFLLPNLPFSEYYLEKSFDYILFRYIIPFATVLFFLFFNFSKLKAFIEENKIIKSFVFSQIIYYFLLGVGMLFSFYFISSRGASMIFFFVSILSIISLTRIKSKKLKYFFSAVFFVFVLLVPLFFYINAPQYNYEQFNEKHLALIEWMGLNLNENSKIYGDIKMTKAISLKTGLKGHSQFHEFGVFMEMEIIPVYFSSDLNSAIEFFNFYGITHLVLTKEMSELMVQPANELLMPATHLDKFDESDYFNKIFENNQVRIYKIKIEEN